MNINDGVVINNSAIFFLEMKTGACDWKGTLFIVSLRDKLSGGNFKNKGTLWLMQ